MTAENLRGKKALVMGLGLHGGGLESIRYLLKHGAEVTCTDLRSRSELKPSIEALSGRPVRYILGEHRMKDFDEADIIVKNPAVPADSKWIAGRSNIETDISLFLRAVDSPILAVTGSKGKSTVVTALNHIMARCFYGTRLGGNITVSPLSFADDVVPGDPVILELSSWQLADLRGRGLLKPRVACITNLMHDHQNRYASFADYEADKAVIYENLGAESWGVFPDNERGRRWAAESGARTALIAAGPDSTASPAAGGFLDADGRGWFRSDAGMDELVPRHLSVPGAPFRLNMLFASVIARLYGCPAADILEAHGDFAGVPYRMEMFLERNGIRYYDDTAATIPDAAAAAVRALATEGSPVILIAGGTDKELDFTPFDAVPNLTKRIILLKGSATDALLPRLKAAGVNVTGPFSDMDEAVADAAGAAEAGDAVLLSPGAASFGMFRHEFERGDAFKAACRRHG